MSVVQDIMPPTHVQYHAVVNALSDPGIFYCIVAAAVISFEVRNKEYVHLAVHSGCDTHGRSAGSYKIC